MQIQTYIGQENPSAAYRIATQIVAACDRLESLPHRGRPGLVPGTGELVALRAYVIVYQIISDEVQILRIWNGAQDGSGGWEPIDIHVA